MTIQEKIDAFKNKRGFQEQILSLIKEGYDKDAVMMAYKLVEQDFLTSNPKRKEIIITIAKAKSLDFAYYAREILYIPEIENSENSLEIVQIIANANNYLTPSILTEFSVTPNFWKNKNNLNILKTILNSDISYDDFIYLVDSGILFKEDACLILDILLTSSQANNALMDYITNEPFEIDYNYLKTLANYNSQSRLESLKFNLYSSEEFSDLELRHDILSTLRYFENNDTEEVELFSCFELYSEDTDPTIERELNQLYGDVLSLPHDNQVKMIKKLKKQIKKF